MNKYIGLFLLIVILLIPMIGNSFVNEPSGFNGIKWGTDLSSIKEMKVIIFNGSDIAYIKDNDKFNIKGVTLDNYRGVSIIYGAYKGHFYQGAVMFRGFGSFNVLTDKFTDDLKAKPEVVVDKNRHIIKFLWLGKKVYIEITYNTKFHVGNIIYTYIPIYY